MQVHTKQLVFTQYSSYFDKHWDINDSFLLKTLASYFTNKFLPFVRLGRIEAGNMVDYFWHTFIIMVFMDLLGKR